VRRFFNNLTIPSMNGVVIAHKKVFYSPLFLLTGLKWSFTCSVQEHTARSCCVLPCFVGKADSANVAQSKHALQSSTFGNWDASFGVDNELSTVACTGHVSSPQPWWAVDLGSPMAVARVSVTNDHHAIYGQLR